MMSLYFLLLSLVALVSANPVPEPTPAAVLEDRAACSQDNCLRALSNHISSASPYCSSYTKATQTATTGFPTYIPSTCGPSRVSSACTCLVPAASTSSTSSTISTTSSKASTTSTASTSTAAQCTHTKQVISNPSFYGNYNGESPSEFSTQLYPWTISHISGSGPGCSLGPNSYDLADSDRYWGDPGYVICSFNNTAGQDTVSISVDLCPGMNYTFVAHTACDYIQYQQGAVAIHYVVHFNGVTIVPSTQACVPCKDPNSCAIDGTTYYEVSAPVTGPASGSATIQFVVTGSADPKGGFVLPFLMDIIELTAVGYTGSPYNS